MIINITKLKNDENGFAAIVIALVLILVLSLITVGFADLMNTNQKQALDSQLSSQAYYAAETGVNDAAAAINSGYTSSKSCAPDPSNIHLASNKVGTSTGATYPCLLINPTPNNIKYGSISSTIPQVTELEGVDTNGNPQVIQSVNISWKDASGNNTNFDSDSDNCSDITSESAWSHPGILKVSLIPINSLTRSSLINNTYTAYLCPSAGDGSIDYSGYSASDIGENSGVIVSGDCNSTATPNYCNIGINNLGTLDQATYIVVLQSIYSATQASISVLGVGSETPLDIANAQTEVDSTGEAEGVLRRIEVRLPDHDTYSLPAGVVQGMAGICKQLQLVPNGGTDNCPADN